MQRTVAQKMGIKPESRTFFQSAPEDALNAIDIPPLEIAEKLSGQFDYIHLFVSTGADMYNRLPILKKHLGPKGMLWVSWPKNKQLSTDLNVKEVIRIGYETGLVESTCLSINTTWSGLKFTFPKKGKVYNNSYGTLKLLLTSLVCLCSAAGYTQQMEPIPFQLAAANNIAVAAVLKQEDKLTLMFHTAANAVTVDVPVGFFSGNIGSQKMSVIGGEILKRFNMIISADRLHIYLQKNRSRI